MTSILSWNIQNGKGVDGKISLVRIADVIVGMGDPDVICLQEVSRGLALDTDGQSPDQISELAELFPEHKIFFGVAIDTLCSDSTKRWQYGNAVLSRLPLLARTSHILPRPAIEGVRYMTRQATEIVVDSPSGPLCVINTHLEFHSERQKQAQINRLRELHQEALEERKLARQVEPAGPYQFVPRPIDAVYCGDFNLTQDSAEYNQLLAPLLDNKKPFHDAWITAHPNRPHEPTCGIHDHQQWPQGSHCRDFFFVSDSCAGKVRDVRVNTTTDASDHQPLILELTDG